MTILYADDDPDEIFLFYDVLMELDPSVTCITAGNGEEVLQMLTHVTPDLIFLDVHMPIMDGKECMKAIRENPLFEAIPVILYSNEKSDVTANYCQFGAAGFIRKTANVMQLREQLRAILATRVPISR
jgi:CheY-like chemotaxis protein